MVTKIEAWKCDICGRKYYDKAEVVKHQKIKPSKPLPVGFTYVYKQSGDAFASYYQIIIPSKKRFDKLHKPLQIEVCLSLDFYTKSELSINPTGASFSEWWRRNEECYTLGKRDFRNFQKIYNSSDNQEIRKNIGLQATDLTNKL